MIITCPPRITEDVVNRFRGRGAYETQLDQDSFWNEIGLKGEASEKANADLFSDNSTVKRLMYGTKVVYVVPLPLVDHIGFADMAVINDDTTDEYFTLDGGVRREMRMNVLLDGTNRTHAPDGRTRAWPSLSNVINLLG